MLFEDVALLEREEMANITDPPQLESSGWGFGQLVTSPSIGLVVSVGGNIVLHTVLNELHEILKTILTGNVSDIFLLELGIIQEIEFKYSRMKISRKCLTHL